MRDRIDRVMYFAVDFDTAWTNNPAEQAIRTAKLQAKSAAVGAACAD